MQRKTRRLLPGEDPHTRSFEAARRWLTIYEQRESLLGQTAPHDNLTAEESAALAEGAAYWRHRTVELSGLDLDSDRRVLRQGTQGEVSLTRREVELLEFLAQHPRQHFPDHVLAVRAWGQRLSGDQVRIYVRRLRGKLIGTGWTLSSKRGYGYMLDPDGTDGRGGQVRLHAAASREDVAHAIGRARALMAAQTLNLRKMEQATTRLKSIFNGESPAGYSPASANGAMGPGNGELLST